MMMVFTLLLFGEDGKYRAAAVVPCEMHHSQTVLYVSWTCLCVCTDCSPQGRRRAAEAWTAEDAQCWDRATAGEGGNNTVR